MTTEKKDRMAEDDWESSVEFSGPTGNAAGVNFLWVGDAGSTEPLAAFDEAMLALRYLSNAAEDQPRDELGRFAAGTHSVESVVAGLAALFKVHKDPMSGGECGMVVRTMQELNPEFEPYAITTSDPYDPSPDARGISHIVASTDGGKTFVDGRGKPLSEKQLLQEHSSGQPRVVKAEYHESSSFRAGGYYKAADSPEKFESGASSELKDEITGKVSNSNPDQPRDDHGRFAAHPGVGKLRELFSVKGIPHEHFSDEELSSMLHTAGAVTAPAAAPQPPAKERPAAARKEPAPASEGHAERVKAVSDLKAHGERLADDPATPTAVLDRHVADAEAAVDSHVKGMSADELKSMARAVGVVVGGGMGKGALVKEIKSVLTAPARAVLSIRQ